MGLRRRPRRGREGGRPTLQEIPISSNYWQMLRQRYMSPTCATLSFPGWYPLELVAIGIGERKLHRNDLVGTTSSVATQNCLVLGTAWDHHRGHHTDEEIVLIDGNRLVARRFYHGTFEQDYPAYSGCFRGNKDYLRP